MQEIKLNDIADSLIIFNKITFDRLLKSETPADSIALYTFYYYTAKWQGTNQPKCTTSYVANGLKWSESRVRKAKKELLDIGLVEDITSKDESGKIIGHFVKVNYFSLSTLKETHTIENPQCGIHDTVEKLETNALKEYIKCLNKEIEMLKNKINIYNKEKIIKKETRHKYGMYNNVLLTDDDLEKLKSEFADWEQRIERLSEYIASTGKSYKNHLATIRSWARKEKPNKKVGANGIVIGNQKSDLEGVF